MTEPIRLVPRNKFVSDMIDTRKKDRLISFKHGHIVIHNYKKGDNKDFEKYLSAYDTERFKYVMVGGYLMKDYRELRIPRGYPIETLMKFFPHHKCELDNSPYPHDRVEFDIYSAPRDDIQRVVINHTLSLPPYEKVKKYTQQVVTMDTGDGKTYTMVATQSAFKCKSIIFVPNKKLSKQWTDAYLKFTSLAIKDIKIIQGSEMCEAVRLGKYSNISVFIIVINSFESYVKRFGEVKAQEMLSATRAYMKIIDETHRNMGRLVQLDALSNFRMNYYLTASFARTDKMENMIFKKIFNNVPKIGHGLKTTEEKHTNILIKKYYWQPSTGEIRSMVNRSGLNSKTYEQLLLTSGKPYFEKELRKMLLWMKNERVGNSRFLLMSSTINGIEYLAKVCQENLPGMSIGPYHSKLKESEKLESLKCDIIISTERGLGEGADIADLQFTLNIVTYSSGEVSSKQFSGRNRKQAFKTVYIEMVNDKFYRTAKQFENRKDYLKKYSKSGDIVIID